jgi:hypothetical protein
LPPEPNEKNVIGINAGNGPLPIPCGMYTFEVKVSDFPFLVTITLNEPLADPAAGGVYVAVMAQSEQSGFGPISYFSIAALISLRRRSHLANEVLRVPLAN